jgi:hypothetical protein
MTNKLFRVISFVIVAAGLALASAPNAAFAHESDVLSVTPIVLPDGIGFTLHVHAADVDLWWLDTHLQKKKSKQVEFFGTFSLGDMIYTPDPLVT